MYVFLWCNWRNLGKYPFKYTSLGATYNGTNLNKTVTCYCQNVCKSVFELHCTLDSSQKTTSHIFQLESAFQLQKIHNQMSTKMQSSVPIAFLSSWMLFKLFLFFKWFDKGYSAPFPATLLLRLPFMSLIIDIAWEEVGIQVSHQNLEVRHFVLYTILIMFLFLVWAGQEMI